MIKFLLQALLGTAMTLGGSASGYLYIDSLSQRNNLVFLAAGAVLVTAGIFLLLRAKRAAAALTGYIGMDEAMAEKYNVEQKAGFGSMLEKNNQMVSDYAKVAKNRDQLKVLEIAGAAEAENK